MDVGADNFRFNLDTQNGLSLPVQATRPPATTELHLDSLDRYLPSMLQSTTYFQNYPNQNLVKLAGPILLNSTAPTSGTQAIIYSRAGAEKLLRSKIVTELINFDDFVNLAVLKSADVHRPDLVAGLWPDGKPEFVALKAEPDIVGHREDFPSTVVLGY